MIINYRQAIPFEEPESPGINYVGYIESSGTQYIDTGFKPNNNTRVVMDVDILQTDVGPIFGTRTGIGGISFVTWVMKDTQFRDDFGSGSTNEVNVSSVLGRITIDKNKNVCAFGATSTSHSLYTFQLSTNLLLFAVTTDGNIDDRKLSGRLYACKVYDNDVLIRDYAPALDVSGVACLYDKVSEQYVYNAGTGSFTTP